MPEAGKHLREALEIFARAGNRLRLIGCLDNCGRLCVATQRWADAVTMWAAHAACLEELGVADLPSAKERRREPLRTARQSLGPDRAQAAEKRGNDMTLATAAELAMLLTGIDSQGTAGPAGTGEAQSREQELVIMVVEGRTDAEIAGQLHVSVRTVRHRLDRIRNKAGCPRRADLIRLALQTGLV